MIELTEGQELTLAAVDGKALTKVQRCSCPEIPHAVEFQSRPCPEMR